MKKAISALPLVAAALSLGSASSMPAVQIRRPYTPETTSDADLKMVLARVADEERRQDKAAERRLKKQLARDAQRAKQA